MLDSAKLSTNLKNAVAFFIPDRVAGWWVSIKVREKILNSDIMTRPLGAIKPHSVPLCRKFALWGGAPHLLRKPANIASHRGFAAVTVARRRRWLKSKRR